MSLKPVVVNESFQRSLPDDIPMVKRGDIVLVSEDELTDPRPFAVTLKTPRVQGTIPRTLLEELPEAQASQYLAEFQAMLMLGDTDASASSAAVAAAEVPAPQPYKALLFTLGGAAPLQGVVDLLRRGERLTLFEVVGEHYRHKPNPSAPATPAAPAAALTAPDGQRLTQGYWVLGAGAFGITFRCDELRDAQHREVAIKVTGPPQSELERNFFHTEAFVMAAVNHRNILRAAGPPFEAQLEPGGPMLRCLVTPFCESGDLDAVIRRHIRAPAPGDPAERLVLLQDMVHGLAYLHGKPFPDNDHRVLHNDLKPTNVLLRHDATTGRLTALLADLGLACVYTGGSLTYGLCRGTPGFMAPELFAGSEGQSLLATSGMRPGNTPATDVYAMGVTLYCLYSQTDTAHKTEERPCEDELREAYAELSKMAGGPALVELLVRMCSPDPTARPSMERVQAAVEVVAGAPLDSTPTAPPATATGGVQVELMPLNFRPTTPDLAPFSLQVYRAEIVMTVKMMIEEKFRIGTERQRLVSATGAALDDNKTLAHYEVKSGDTLVLMVTPEPAAPAAPAAPPTLPWDSSDFLLLTVRTLTGMRYELQMKTTDTVDQMKGYISNQASMPPEQQCLLFKGRELKDGKKTLADCGIGRNDVIHLSEKKTKGHVIAGK
ncbi:hypothetical protein PAPYR_7986 [Paratrimastix pyriformis]|uniref:mitogen-activated protein kinase kinase kinase n=1 Tax=Paratrimastix pyriformis TaxID=342808 RepID=A0ABQ8UD21_9EUKA|nr:hypothetical protein PAPYR_7986 [Paratrimastix pyriformis]